MERTSVFERAHGNKAVARCNFNLYSPIFPLKLPVMDNLNQFRELFRLPKALL
jgi:hypothetical protein